MPEPDWLLFLPQLPSAPSSLRVLVWRRLRAAGALGLQHGVWVLPHAPEHERFLRDLLAEVAPQGGAGLLFRAAPADATGPPDLVARFGAERDREYAELVKGVARFAEDIRRETAGGGFAFAELEDVEADWEKLGRWRGRIAARDFFGAPGRAAAEVALARGREALAAFAAAVYAHQGVEEAGDEPERRHQTPADGQSEMSEGAP